MKGVKKFSIENITMIDIVIELINECKYCGKEFKNKYNVIRHEKKCKFKIKVELENEINNLKNQFNMIINQHKDTNIKIPT